MARRGSGHLNAHLHGGVVYCVGQRGSCARERCAHAWPQRRLHKLHHLPAGAAAARLSTCYQPEWIGFTSYNHKQAERSSNWLAEQDELHHTVILQLCHEHPMFQQTK